MRPDVAVAPPPAAAAPVAAPPAPVAKAPALAIPTVNPAIVPAANGQPARHANTYMAVCSKCNLVVMPFDGQIMERSPAGVWNIQHRANACPWPCAERPEWDGSLPPVPTGKRAANGTDGRYLSKKARKELEGSHPYEQALLCGHADGYYAIADPSHNNDLCFYRVVRSEESAKGICLQKIVSNRKERLSREEAVRVVALLDALQPDATEAMQRYGREIGHCGHCHRKLTDEISRKHGFGPVCRHRDSFIDAEEKRRLRANRLAGLPEPKQAVDAEEAEEEEVDIDGDHDEEEEVPAEEEAKSTSESE